MKTKTMISILVIFSIAVLGFAAATAYFFVEYNNCANAIDEYQSTFAEYQDAIDDITASRDKELLINKTLREKNEKLNEDINNYKEKLKKKTEDLDTSELKKAEIARESNNLKSSNEKLTEQVNLLKEERDTLIKKYQEVSLSDSLIADYTGYYKLNYISGEDDQACSDLQYNGIYCDFKKTGEMTYDAYGRKQWLDGYESTIKIKADHRYTFQDVSVTIQYQIYARNLITGEYETVSVNKIIQLPESGDYNETFKVKQLEVNDVRYIITERSAAQILIVDCSGTVIAK